MADDITLNAGTGGKTVRALDDGTVVWPAGVVAYPTTIGTPDVVQIVDLTHGLPSLLTAGEAHVGAVGGQAVSVNATYTRPSDTTAYTAKDAISNSTSSPAVLTFAGMGRVNAGTGYVVKGRLLTSQTTNTARYRLHLYKTSPTALNDNAACTAPLYADDAKWVGAIDFPAAQTEGSGGTAAWSIWNDRLHFKCDTSDTNLYGILEALDAFTPANAQTYTITLSAEID